MLPVLFYSVIILAAYAIFLIDFNFDTLPCGTPGCVVRPCHGHGCVAGGCMGAACRAGDCVGENCRAGDCVGDSCTAGSCTGPRCTPGSCEGKDCTKGTAEQTLPRSLLYRYCDPKYPPGGAPPADKYIHRYTGASSTQLGDRIEKDNIVLQIDNPLLFTIPYTYKDSQCGWQRINLFGK